MAGPAPFMMWLTPLSPHTEPGKFYAVPAPRHNGSHAGARWRPPNFGNAGDSTRPPAQRHPPLTAAEVAAIDFEYAKAREALEAVDDMVEQVFAALERTGELANTVVMFTSDHGFYYGEAGIVRGKIHPYEAALRVPLLVTGPGFANRVDDRLTVNADLTATIADLAGLTERSTQDADGVTVGLNGDVQSLQFVDGRFQQDIIHAATVPLDGIPLHALFMDRAVPIHGRTGARTYVGVRTDSEVWWHFNGTQQAERYDLTTDPWQLRNLTTAGNGWRLDPAREALLQRLHRCAGAGCVAGWP